MVLKLEGAHNVLTPYDEVHDAGNQGSLRVIFILATDRYDVYELHERQEFLVTLWRALKEFQLELLLQVAERLINILIPTVHEPGGPHVWSLKLVKVPVKHFTNFVLLCYYLVYGH